MISRVKYIGVLILKKQNIEKSIKKNVIWNGILSLSTIIFPFVTFPYITRVLGVEVNGAINFSLSTVNYFSLFATLGLSTYGVKACACVKDSREELSKVVQELLIISGIAAVIVLGVLYLAAWFIPQLSSYSIYLTVFSLNIIFNVFGINWMYQGIEKYEYVTTRSIIFKIISIVMMFMFVKKPEDGIIYAAISVFASVGGNILNIIYSRRFISYKKIKKKYEFKRHMSPILVLFATNLAVNVYSNLDSVMLGLLCGDYPTGIYYVAVKIKTILITLISSFSIVIMSRLSYVNKNSNINELQRVLKKSYSVIIFITSSVSVYFILLSKESILFLSGSDYLEAITPMRILMPTLIFSSLSQILGSQYSVSVGKEKNLMKAVIIGAVVNIVMNLLLIPKFSYNGAAIGTLIAEITQCLIQMILAKDIVKKVFSIKKLIYVLFSTTISAIGFILSYKLYSSFSAFIVLVVSAILFFSIYSIILILLKYDLCVEVLEILKKIKKG